MTHVRDPLRSVAQPKRLVEQLERVAEAVGLEVRRERLDIGDARAPGGLCRVEGRQVCILADDLSAEAEALTLARALLHYDVESVFVPPIVRNFLENVRAGQGAAAGRREGES